MNLLEAWERKNKLTISRARIEAVAKKKEKLATNRAYRARIAAQKKIDQRSNMTYAEHLAGSKPITQHLAPVLAQPKRTKGDTLAHRDRLKRMEEHGEIFVHTLTTTKGGRVVRA